MASPPPPVDTPPVVKGTLPVTLINYEHLSIEELVNNPTQFHKDYFSKYLHELGILIRNKGISLDNIRSITSKFIHLFYSKLDNHQQAKLYEKIAEAYPLIASDKKICFEGIWLLLRAYKLSESTEIGRKLDKEESDITFHSHIWHLQNQFMTLDKEKKMALQKTLQVDANEFERQIAKYFDIGERLVQKGYTGEPEQFKIFLKDLITRYREKDTSVVNGRKEALLTELPRKFKIVNGTPQSIPKWLIFHKNFKP